MLARLFSGHTGRGLTALRLTEDVGPRPHEPFLRGCKESIPRRLGVLGLDCLYDRQMGLCILQEVESSSAKNPNGGECEDRVHNSPQSDLEVFIVAISQILSCRPRSFRMKSGHSRIVPYPATRSTSSRAAGPVRQAKRAASAMACVSRIFLTAKIFSALSGDNFVTYVAALGFLATNPASS